MSSSIIVVNPVITSFAPDDGVYVVNETFQVIFICNATGIPAPDIQWLRGSEIHDPAVNSTLAQRLQLSTPTVDEPDRSVSTVTRMLTISNTMESDADMYSCVATNNASIGRAQEEFSLFVQGTFPAIQLVQIIILCCVHQFLPWLAQLEG